MSNHLPDAAEGRGGVFTTEEFASARNRSIETLANTIESRHYSATATKIFAALRDARHYF